MARLRLGEYSFVIDGDKLELEPEVSKTFTRDELPNELKPLFDLLETGINKPVYIVFLSNSYSNMSGYATHISSGIFLTIENSLVLSIIYTGNLEITFKEY